MNKLIKNTSWLLVSQIVQMLLNFFVGMFSVRYLGPSNYGVITYVSAYVTTLLSVCTLGLDTVIIKQLIHTKNKDGEIIASAVLLRIIASSICYLLLMTILFFADNQDPTIMIVGFIEGLQLLFYSFFSINSWFQYKFQSKITSIVDMITLTTVSLLKLYCIITAKNIYWFAAITSIQYFLIACILVPAFRKQSQAHLYPNLRMMKELLIGCAPFLVSTIMLSLYSQIDRIMIKQILNSSDMVGFYSAALNICALVGLVTDAISVSSRPVLMELKKNSDPNYNLRITQTLAIIIWLSLFFSIIVTVFAKPILLLLYGDAYLHSISTLRVVTWYTLFINLGIIRDLWLIGEGQSKYVSYFSVFGTVINILLNFILIQAWGIIGAAVATLVTQFCVNFLLPLISKNTRCFGLNVLNALLLKNVHLSDLLTLIKRNK